MYSFPILVLFFHILKEIWRSVNFELDYYGWVSEFATLSLSMLKTNYALRKQKDDFYKVNLDAVANNYFSVHYYVLLLVLFVMLYNVNISSKESFLNITCVAFFWTDWVTVTSTFNNSIIVYYNIKLFFNCSKNINHSLKTLNFNIVTLLT